MKETLAFGPASRRPRLEQMGLGLSMPALISQLETCFAAYRAGGSYLKPTDDGVPIICLNCRLVGSSRAGCESCAQCNARWAEIVRPRRGRPRVGDLATRLFAASVAWLLDQYGFTVTGYRDGLLARVLRVFFEDAGRSVADLKHDATRAATALKVWKDEPLVWTAVVKWADLPTLEHRYYVVRWRESAPPRLSALFNAAMSLP